VLVLGWQLNHVGASDEDGSSALQESELNFWVVVRGHGQVKAGHEVRLAQGK